MSKKLLRIYERLLRRFGFLNWWPGGNEFEIMIGAILTQSTAWKNVEKAIGKLKGKKVLNLTSIARIKQKDLAKLIRASGYYNEKAKRIKNFVQFLLREFSGDLNKMKSERPHDMRRKLLSVRGIGFETADSILLYALNKKFFVVDAYTRRVFSRIGFIESGWDYEKIQSFFMSNLPARLRLYNDFHAQIVILGKEICRKKPGCSICPIVEFCSHGRSQLSSIQNQRVF